MFGSVNFVSPCIGVYSGKGFNYSIICKQHFMIKPSLFYQFFDWKKLLLAGALSLGVMTNNLFAQTQLQEKVSLGQVSDITKKFTASNLRQAKAASLKHTGANGSAVELVPNKTFQETGKTTFAGFTGKGEGTFWLSLKNGKIEGNAILYKSKKAYEYSTGSNGEVYAQEVDINKLVCVEYGADRAKQPVSQLRTEAISHAASIFQLQSFPLAPAVIYLDFDGEVVNNSRWNGGNTINAAAAELTDAEIQRVFDIVSEDYRPFNINVTTDYAVYQKAIYGRKTRVIITQTSQWLEPQYGGVADIGSFNGNQEMPCWVIADRLGNAENIAEASSHEAGHTFNLNHDGKDSDQYYTGSGLWAPIMGVAYGKSGQWCKGEYQGATNTIEDDIAIIAASGYNLGLRTDDAGNDVSTAPSVLIRNGQFLQQGVIETGTDKDVYKLILNGTGIGQLNFNLDLINPVSNLRVEVKIFNAQGTLISADAPTLGGPVNRIDNLAAGTYYVQIDGIGDGDPAATGFSDYASLGQYAIRGFWTAPSGGGCTAQVWNAATAYSKDAVVQYNGIKYIAKWWTQNNVPDVNAGEGKPWTSQGPCSVVTAPAVSITNPASSPLNINDGASVTVTASASDPDGIAYVEFYYNDKYIGKDTQSPYTIVWNNIAYGNYALTAKAVDVYGSEGYSAPIGVNVSSLPKAKILAPLVNQIVRLGRAVDITLDVYDIDGTVTKAEFYFGSVKIGERTAAPWSIVGSPIPAATLPGALLPVNIVLTDNAGNLNTVGTHVKVVTYNVAPTITLLAPSLFVEGYDCFILADPKDTDGGKVAKVEYYVNGVKAGQNTSAPWQLVIPNIQRGHVDVYAVVTDDDGVQTTSATSSFKITTKPVVAFNSPVANAEYVIGSPLTIDMNATDADGVVTQVILSYAPDTPPVTITAAPWVYNTTVPSPTTADSIITIAAIAFDNDGISIGYNVKIKAVLPKANTAPTVTIVTPTPTTRYVVGSSVTVSATVTDADNDAIQKVEIWSPHLGAGSLVTLTSPPYQTTYTNLPSTGNVLGLTFVVKAYDARGAINAADVFIYTDRIPTVSITSPAAGALLAPGAVTITADANDDVLVNRVEFYNQMGALIYTDNSAPYAYVTPALASGNYTYRAAAFDNKGQASATSNVSFLVNKAPTVSITSPANGAVVQAGVSLLLRANAADTDGSVAKVEFYSSVGGKLGEDATAPYEWTIANPVKSNVIFTAKAIDNLGTGTVSPAIAVTINGAPVIAITAPLPSAGIQPKYLVGGSRTVSANVTDTDGTITKVEFTHGSNLGLVTKTAAPYTATFTNLPAPSPDGSYWFTVKAYDNNGGITSQVVIVYKNRIPTILITSPAQNASVPAGNVAVITAPNDPDFTSGKIEYYNGTTKVGETVFSGVIPTPTVSGNVTLAAGTYALTAKITDDMGQSGVSPVVNFTVTPTTTCADPAWNAATIYTNEIVSRLGKRYQAKWWTQGNAPETNSDPNNGGVWTLLGNCGARTANVSAMANHLSVYPNPVVSDATVTVDLVSDDKISIDVFNTYGVKVTSVFAGAVEAGTHNFALNTQNLAAGVYFVRVSGASISGEITIVKN